MSPISDIGAFRNGRWKPEHFLKAIRMGSSGAERGRCMTSSHPACLYAMDLEFRVIELICDLVKRAGDRATFASLDQIAGRGIGSTQHSQ